MRLGRKYEQAYPLFERGTSNLLGVLEGLVADKRRADEEARAIELLTKPAVPAEEESFERIYDRERAETLGGLPPAPLAPAQPARQRNISELGPEDITELILMGSGEGTKRLDALQKAEELLSPRVDPDRYKNVPEGASLYDLISGQSVHSNPRTRKEEAKFNLSDHPLDVQQAYNTANNLSANEEDRRRAALYFKSRTGLPIDVSRKAPDSSGKDGDFGSRIRSVNGGVYYLTGTIGPDGVPEYREIIPTGLAPESQLRLLERMEEAGVISEEMYQGGLKQIAQAYKLPGSSPQTPPAGGAATSQEWEQAVQMLLEKGYSIQQAEELLVDEGFSRPE